MKCAVFASGGGTNFQALLDRKESGELHVDFVLFIGNNSKAKSFERAGKYGIHAVHIAPSHFAGQSEYEDKLLSILRQHEVELIILAGYMKKIPLPVIKAFKNRILNIHPALLPSFGGKMMYGKKVHKTVLDYGAKVTGVTIHLADQEYDHGPIILQRTIQVLDQDDPDTLAKRVLVLEHDSYWRAVEAFARGRITIKDRRAFGKV